jgi:uncharacterized protein YndB with AHSA1/START domain
VTVRAERGVSAPPEVVFSTATDPTRLAAWLPPALRDGRREPQHDGDTLAVRWRTDGRPTFSARLRVDPAPTGGTRMRLELDADPPDDRLTEIADESLASLAREVADNLTAG